MTLAKVILEILYQHPYQLDTLAVGARALGETDRYSIIQELTKLRENGFIGTMHTNNGAEFYILTEEGFLVMERAHRKAYNAEIEGLNAKNATGI